MPLGLRLARSNDSLWRACVGDFLDELDGHSGPTGYGSYLWLTHRLQRDALLEAAEARGLPGWLGPPFAFFSDLPALFEIRQPRIGLLERRMRIGRLAAERGRELDVRAADRSDPRGIAVALDGLFGELLPDGVTPERLREALSGLAVDGFGGRRNDWITAVYADYLARLEAEGRYDPRAIHARVAERIRQGALSDALNGATRLHIYGITSLRTHRRLLETLRGQDEVEVTLYLPRVQRTGEWAEFLDGAEPTTPVGTPAGAVRVQPAPDARRELEWVAGRVKELLVGGDVEPHRIAVVARTGREDTRRAHEVFRAAGIPGSARIRSRLAEIPALKAILHLFRGAATGWPYRPLRHVLESPYFRTDIDAWPIDRIAGRRRVRGLDGWQAQLDRLRRDADAAAERAEREEDEERARRKRESADRLARTRRAFDDFRAEVDALSDPVNVTGWIERTIRLLDPGIFEFRRNLCRPGDRDDRTGNPDPSLRTDRDAAGWDVVRLDQRGVENLKRLLTDWRRVEEERCGSDADTEGAIGPREWYTRLRRFLESNELSLRTPLGTGVQILEAHEAALFPFEHLFVIHANDGVFPRRPPVGALFSDEERTQLAERGLPLTHRTLWIERERTLWGAVAGVPDLTITYRTADVRGTPLLPSLMVPEHAADDEIPRTVFAWGARFGSCRAWGEPISPVQARRTAAAELARLKRERKAGGVRVTEPAVLHQALLAAYAESRRGAGPPGSGREAGEPGPWNGQVRDPAVLAHLADRFGEDRVWSASQLELYAGCPFHFLIQRVLHLDEREQAEEETSPLTFGAVAHDLLERFYRRLSKTVGDVYPDALTGRVANLLDEATEEVFAETERRAAAGEDWLGLPALWAVRRQELREAVREYVAWELDRIARSGERPYDFEVEFGYGDAEPVELVGPDLQGRARTLRVAGRIDRVDVSGAGDELVYHVLDYKSTSTPGHKGYRDGGTIQAPLYMSALERLLGVTVASGRYRAIRNPGQGGRVTRDHDLYDRAMRIAFSIPARICGGLFEAKAARSTGWPSYRPRLAVCRTDAEYDEGSRFDD